MGSYIGRCILIGGDRRRLGAWFLALGLAGCATQVPREARLAELAMKLNGIETVQLEEQSRSEPVTIERATEQAAKDAIEPNETRPVVKLTLDEVRAAALANNLELKVELVDPAIAQYAVDAERAKFEAVFFGSVRYSRTELTGNDDWFSTRSYEAGIEQPLPTGGLISASVPLRDTSSGGVSSAAISVSFIQNLLRGAGTRINTHSIRIADYQKGIVDARTKLAAIHILGNTDVAYWQLYAARKELDVRREQYKLAQDQLQGARAKVAAGSAPKFEIVQAQAGLASRLEDVITAETAVRDRERDLKRVMNRADMPMHSRTGIVPIQDPDPRGLDLDAEAIKTAAMENRMELIQLELRLAVDDIGVDLARNNTLPQLNVDYTYGAAGRGRAAGGAFRDIFDGPAEDHRFGLSAVVPLGNRAAEARLRQARLERVRTRLDRNRLEQIIHQEVYEAVDEMEQNWRRILAAEQGAVAAYRDYQVEQLQFQLGTSRSTDVLLAASRLADAQLRRIRAFAEYEVAQVRLARATGTLLGRGRIQLAPVTGGDS